MERYIDEKLKEHDETLKEHSERLNTLEKSDAVHTSQIDVLCNRISGLTNAIWALVLVVVGGFVTFFFTLQGSLFAGK